VEIYEIIRHSIRPATIEDLGWTRLSEHKAFTASANRPDVSGSRARHARMPGDPPKRQMDEPTARQFISKLMNAWLESLEYVAGLAPMRPPRPRH
jgi:hypothetical protein